MQFLKLSDEQKKQLKERSWKQKLRDFALVLIFFAVFGWLAHLLVMWIYRVDENISFPLVTVIGVVMSVLSIITAMITTK